MNITGAFFEGMNVKSLQLKDASISDGNGFKDTFSKVSSNTREPVENKIKAPKEANNQRPREDVQNKSSEDDTQRDKIQKPEVKEDTAKKEVSSKETKETKEPEVIKPALTEEKPDLNAEILALICAQLNIEPEKLQDMLKELNIEPSELLEGGNMNKLIQKVFDVNNSVELLKIPDIEKIIKNLEEEILKLSKDTVNIPIESVESAKTETVKAISIQPPKEANLSVSSSNEEIGLTDTDSSNTTAVTAETVKTVKAPSSEKNQDQPAMDLSRDSGDALLENTLEINIHGITTDFKAVTNNQIKAEAVKNVNPQEVITQIVDKIKIDVKANSSEVRMTIKPESLGEVSLKVATENGIITAQFIAESQRVKEIIESNFNQLKDALNQQGINISQMSVSVSQGDKEKHMQQFQQEKSKSQMRINAILNGIEQEGQMIPEEIDTRKIYQNKVEYVI